MSKNTPGNWIEKDGKIIGNGYNIADVHSYRTIEGQCNAALIAAAPELLEALEKISTLSEDKRLALIAKAKGE